MKTVQAHPTNNKEVFGKCKPSITLSKHLLFTESQSSTLHDKTPTSFNSSNKRDSLTNKFNFKLITGLDCQYVLCTFKCGGFIHKKHQHSISKKKKYEQVQVGNQCIQFINDNCNGKLSQLLSSPSTTMTINYKTVRIINNIFKQILW